MNLKMFIEFPGILILIGVILLIISIIISIIAYRKPSKKDTIKNTQDNNVTADLNNSSLGEEPPALTNQSNYNFFNTSPEAIFNEPSNINNIDEATVVSDDAQKIPDLNNTMVMQNFNTTPFVMDESNIPVPEQNTPDLQTNNTPIAEPVNNDNPSSVEIAPPITNVTSQENVAVVENNNINNIEEVNVNNTDNIEVANANNDTNNIEVANVNNTNNPEVVTENNKPEEIPAIEENQSFTIPDISTIEEESVSNISPLITEELDEPILDDNSEEETIDKILEETRTDFKPIVENAETLKIEENHIEPVEELEHRPIYGGTSPLQNINLNFDANKKEAYSNSDFKPSDNIVTPKEDDIELL